MGWKVRGRSLTLFQSIDTIWLVLAKDLPIPGRQTFVHLFLNIQCQGRIPFQGLSLEAHGKYAEYGPFTFTSGDLGAPSGEETHARLCRIKCHDVNGSESIFAVALVTLYFPHVSDGRIPIRLSTGRLRVRTLGVSAESGGGWIIILQGAGHQMVCRRGVWGWSRSVARLFQATNSAGQFLGVFHRQGWRSVPWRGTLSSTLNVELDKILSAVFVFGDGWSSAESLYPGFEISEVGSKIIRSAEVGLCFSLEIGFFLS